MSVDAVSVHTEENVDGELVKESSIARAVDGDLWTIVESGTVTKNTLDWVVFTSARLDDVQVVRVEFKELAVEFRASTVEFSAVEVMLTVDVIMMVAFDVVACLGIVVLGRVVAAADVTIVVGGRVVADGGRGIVVAEGKVVNTVFTRGLAEGITVLDRVVVSWFGRVLAMLVEVWV